MMRTRLLWLVLVLLAAGPGLAQEKAAREVLPSGLSVIVQETYSSPTVSLNVFVRVGSLHETPENSGISHFYEHMFFRGTPTRSGLEFKRAIESLGGTTNATTSRDFTHYYINLPSAYAEQGLALLADALMNAECSTDSVEKEREVVLEEYRLGRSNPGRILSDRLFTMAFKQHPYGRPIIGTEENLKAIGRPQLLEFKRSYYTPDRTSLVIVGDVDRKRVLEKARELFGSFRGVGSPRDQFTLEPPPTEPLVEDQSGPVSKAYVVLAFLGPSVKDQPDIYGMDVLTFLLGIGEGSVLTELLVEPDIAEATQVDFLTQAHPSLVMVTAVGDRKKVEEMRAGILQGIEKIRQGEFTDPELARAKTILMTTYRFGNETNAGKADSLGFYETIDDWNFATGYLDRIGRVTRDDVVDVARRYLEKSYYGVIMTPEAAPPRREG
ncbi:MAG: insulinase family protein [Armatimonadetes bacterium]|nr:insulinase family protein [Armatimonadota bacterium]